MTFHDDLQAWTQAQFSMLYRRRKRPLADDINKLLRDRLPKDLTIKDGTAVLAEFLRTGGRIVPVNPIGLGIIDHGLLAGSDFNDPQTIRTYSSLKAFLAIEGFTFTDSVGSYLSLNWTGSKSTPATNPQWHNGLGRLFAQGMLGAGREVAEVLPTGWFYAGSLIGLVRAPAGDYWLVTNGFSFGIKMAKLAIPAALQPLEDRIRAGEFTGLAELCAQAEVFGGLVKASPQYEYTAVTQAIWVAGQTKPAGYPAIYYPAPGAGYTYSTMQDESGWGLQFTKQRSGAADEYAPSAIRTLCISVRETGGIWRGYGRSVRYDFNFHATTGNPIAATVTTTDNTDGPCIVENMLRWYSFRGANPALRTFIGTATAGQLPMNTNIWNTPIDLAGWFDDAGDVQTVTWDGMEDWTSYGVQYDSVSIPGAFGSASLTISNWTTGGQGTVSIGGNKIACGQTTYSRSATGSATVVPADSIYTYACEPDYDELRSISIYDGPGTGGEWSSSLVFGQGILVHVLFGFPGVIWIVSEPRAEKGTYSDSFTISYPVSVVEANWLNTGHIIEYFPISCQPELGYEYDVKPSAVFVNYWLQATETGGQLDMSCFVDGATVAAVARDDVTVTRSGDALATVDWGAEAYASAGGHVFAQPLKSPSTWVFPADIPDVSAETVRRWIGGA